MSPVENLDKLLEKAFKVKRSRNTNLTIYYLGRFFPSISLTGTNCSLNCKHCGRIYLKGMTKVRSQNELYKKLKHLHSKGAEGFLISGGLDQRFIVPIDKFSKVLFKAKKKFNLVYNAHCGFVNEKDAEKIVEAGIDTVSIDFVGDEETIKEVYGLNKSPQDYLEVIKNLKRAGVKEVVPHVCVGLYKGKLRGEVKALNILKKADPQKIVITVFVPTKGTFYQNLKPPEPTEVAYIVAKARLMFPDKIINLGCMRPWFERNKFDVLAIKSGVDGIVLPKKETLDFVRKKGLQLRIEKKCCAL